MIKKIVTICLSACLLALCLTACGGSSVKASVTDIAIAAEGVAGIVSPIAIDDDELVYSMALTKENIAEYAGTHTGVSGLSGTVLVIKAASGKAADVKAELESYRTSNADFLSNYPEFETAQVQAKNGRVVAKGDVVALVIAHPDSDYAAVDSALEAAMQ